jgi:hemoglobin-like flavoprotein
MRLESEAEVTTKESYRNHCRENKDFYREFYKRFFGKCPEALEMFTGDVEQQYAKLDLALHSVLNFGVRDMIEPTVLTSVAATHQRLGVSPEQLEHFADCLIETLREFGKEPDSVLEAWKRVLRPSVNYLKERVAAQPAEPVTGRRERMRATARSSAQR